MRSIVHTLKFLFLRSFVFKTTKGSYSLALTSDTCCVTTTAMSLASAPGHPALPLVATHTGPLSIATPCNSQWAMQHCHSSKERQVYAARHSDFPGQLMALLLLHFYWHFYYCQSLRTLLFDVNTTSVSIQQWQLLICSDCISDICCVTAVLMLLATRRIQFLLKWLVP